MLLLRSTLCLAALTMATAAGVRSNRTATTTTTMDNTDEEDPLICRVVVVDTLMDPATPPDQDKDNDDEDDFYCLLPNDPAEVLYKLDLPSEFLDQHPHLSMGETLISIPQGRAVWDRAEYWKPPQVVYPTSTSTTSQTISVHSLHNENDDGRHLQQGPPASYSHRVHGTKTILIIRVSFADRSVHLSRETLAARVLGLGPDSPSRTVASQFDDCSFGKLQLQPATGYGIVNGVMDLRVNLNINGLHRDVASSLVSTAANDYLELYVGQTLYDYDYVLIDLPRGSLRGGTIAHWIAFATIGGNLSFYNDENMGYFSIPVHEMGHNFGLHHSAEGSYSYGDKTGMMGPSSQNIGHDFNGRCFNGHKNWLLGWYSDRAVSIDDVTTQAWNGRLVAFVDYDLATSNNDYVLINVGDYFIQFNRRTKFNYGTLELPNRVTIVRGTRPDRSSNLVAAISEDSSGLSPDSYRVTNFQGTGHDLVIQACDHIYGSQVSADRMDYVHMSIYLDDGIQSSTCNDLLPTLAPSFSPTDFAEVPSGAPSDSNAPSGSQSPSAAPSNAPSFAPSKTVLCDDSKTDRFSIDTRRGRFSKSCRWLSRSPAWQRRLCVPGQDAYHMCEETCGKCTDECHDNADESFFVNRKKRAMNCEWLSRRPKWQGRLCHEGHAAYDLCPEACDRC